MTKYGCHHDLICLYKYIYIYIIQFVFYSNGEALLPPSVFQLQKVLKVYRTKCRHHHVCMFKLFLTCYHHHSLIIKPYQGRKQY